jgi:hypothetical protein
MASKLIEETLKELWYDREEGFDSAASLLKRARAVRRDVRREDVKRFLDAEELGQRQTKRPRKRNSYVPFGPRDQFQVDLADMSGLRGTMLNSTKRALERLGPYRDALAEFIGDRRVIIGRVGHFAKTLEGFEEARKASRLGTLRRALEILGFNVESGRRGGTSYVTRREGGAERGSAPPFAFVCIDVFSKYAHVVPIESKKPAVTARALDECIERMGLPIVIASDEGGEFRSSFAQRVVYYGAKQQMMRPHAYFVERVILTLKSWLIVRIRALGGTWTEHLPAVLKRYNTVVHSATGMPPIEAIKDENRDEVRAELQRNRDTNVVRYPPLAVGDRVRLLQKPSKSAKFAAIAWSRTLYEITEVDNQEGSDVYRLSDAPDDRWYLRFELLKP